MRLMPSMMVPSWPSAQSHFQEFRMILARRLVADRLAIADLNRVLGIEIDNAMVLDIHAGHAVAGGRLKEA